MIHLRCEHCGQAIRVPRTHAGKTGRCPRCKTKIVVPKVAPDPTILLDPLPPRIEETTAPSERGRLADEHNSAATQNDDELLTSLGITPKSRHTGERQTVWFLDILLYPSSRGALIALAIVTGGSIFLTFLGFVLDIVALIGRVILVIYFAWYLAECIEDSAMGGTRAPDTSTPGLGDMWSRVSYLVAVYALFLVPLVVYYLVRRQVDSIFGGLAIWAVVFLPIGLIAMAVMDSTSVLNPFFLLRAILRTFFSYVGMLLLLLGVTVLLGILTVVLLRHGPGLLGNVLASVLDILGSMIQAHILGRFYWRNREKLDWGI